MRKAIKRYFFYIFLIIADLAGAVPRIQVYADEAQATGMNCPEVDPHLRVRAEIKKIELIELEKTSISFQMNVHIKIINVSADPVFVFNREQEGYIGSLLARTEVQASSCHYLFDNRGYPYGINVPYWRALREKLDQKTPSADILHKIEPNGLWEFDKQVGIIRLPFVNGPDDIRSDPHLWLQMELSTWPFYLDEGKNPGETLQKRWKDHGHLIIKDLMTEPVKITLPFAEEPLAKRNKDKGAAFLLANKANNGVKVIPDSGGVQYRILTQGSGPIPSETDTVIVIYTVKTIDGKEVDNQMYQLISLNNFGIIGMKKALLQMPAGSKWEVVIPPEQAFGEGWHGLIEPNSTIIYNIELVKIQKKSTTDEPGHP
jgi:hypothetical protein